MTAIDPWIGLAVLAVTLIGALVKHMETDAKTRAELRALQGRMKKFDGIDANGH